MGGYGAMKWALRQPDRFAAAASLSGVLDVAAGNKVRPNDPHLFTRVFGDSAVTGTPDDLGWLREQIEPDALPALWVGCGTEDPLYGQSVRFVEACASAEVPVTTSFVAGAHTWDLWDAQIQQVLAWLPLEPVSRHRRPASDMVGAGPGQIGSGRRRRRKGAEAAGERGEGIRAQRWRRRDLPLREPLRPLGRRRRGRSEAEALRHQVAQGQAVRANGVDGERVGDQPERGRRHRQRTLEQERIEAAEAIGGALASSLVGELPVRARGGP